MVLLHCGSVWGRAQKRYNHHCLQFCLGGSHPPTLTLMTDPSVPLCMALAPFKGLLWCWSPKGVWVCPCVGSPQEKMPENPTVSSADPTPTGFYSQKLWGLIILALEPWAGCSGVRLAFLASRTSLLLYPPHVGFGLACSVPLHLHLSIPPTHLDECGFLNSLVVGCPHSSIFLMVLSDICCAV